MGQLTKPSAAADVFPASLTAVRDVVVTLAWWPLDDIGLSIMTAASTTG
jgi:hypothetical protein